MSLRVRPQAAHDTRGPLGAISPMRCCFVAIWVVRRSLRTRGRLDIARNFEAGHETMSELERGGPGLSPGLGHTSW